MKSRLFPVACAALVTDLLVSLFVAVAPTQAAVAAGFHITNGRLVDANGTPFVMRGTNEFHTFYPAQTARALADIKSLGANTVRVLLSGGRAAASNGVISDTGDLADIVSNCKANKLVCVLTNYDTTGTAAGAEWPLDRAADFWIDLKSALQGQERSILINIGNEPYGDDATDWTLATTAAIAKLRNAGFHHTLVVDAPNWGQDTQFLMRDNAAAVFNSDPDGNILFDIHMYAELNDAPEIISYLDSFQTLGLPLIIGEFADNIRGNFVDAETIMAQSVSRGIGYLGWSWCGNSGDTLSLNQVTDFNINQMTPWGARLFDGPNGIKATSVQASVYGS